MANVRKFDKPVSVTFRAEESTVIEVERITDNKSQFYNDAINEKLERVKDEL